MINSTLHISENGRYLMKFINPVNCRIFEFSKVHWRIGVGGVPFVHNEDLLHVPLHTRELPSTFPPRCYGPGTRRCGDKSQQKRVVIGRETGDGPHQVFITIKINLGQNSANPIPGQLSLEKVFVFLRSN